MGAGGYNAAATIQMRHSSLQPLLHDPTPFTQYPSIDSILPVVKESLYYQHLVLPRPSCNSLRCEAYDALCYGISQSVMRIPTLEEPAQLA